MLAKVWKKTGIIILIIACLLNITIKLTNRISFSDEILKFTDQIKIFNKQDKK